MATRRAWVLNLDAEEELATAGPYTPSAATRARVAAQLQRIGSIVPEGDVVLDADAGAPLPASIRAGGAWCPTPRALALIERHGLQRPPAPPLDVLRRVNHRRFCAELGQYLPGAALVSSRQQLLSITGAGSITGSWLAKRAFGFSGRGQRRMGDVMRERDLSFCDKAIREHGAIQLEPLVTREADFVLHGEVAVDGGLRLGTPMLQQCDAHGAWQRTRSLQRGELDRIDAEALRTAAQQTGEALCDAGYFGPFGIDAFRWSDPEGALHFHPCVEINARLCMGWFAGMLEC